MNMHWIDWNKFQSDFNVKNTDLKKIFGYTNVGNIKVMQDKEHISDEKLLQLEKKYGDLRSYVYESRSKLIKARLKGW